MYNSELLVEGEHLRDLDRKSERIGGALQKSLKSNQRLRYHALEFPLIAALPDVVIDFKHYFSQTVDYLQLMRTSHYVGSLPDLFREDLAQRFSSFLSRVGLPEVAMAEPPETREGGPQGGSGGGSVVEMRSVSTSGTPATRSSWTKRMRQNGARHRSMTLLYLAEAEEASPSVWGRERCWRKAACEA